jgi:ribosomal protein L9
LLLCLYSYSSVMYGQKKVLNKTRFASNDQARLNKLFDDVEKFLYAPGDRTWRGDLPANSETQLLQDFYQHDEGHSSYPKPGDLAQIPKVLKKYKAKYGMPKRNRIRASKDQFMGSTSLEKAALKVAQANPEFRDSLKAELSKRSRVQRPETKLARNMLDPRVRRNDLAERLKQLGFKLENTFAPSMEHRMDSPISERKNRIAKALKVLDALEKDMDKLESQFRKLESTR